MHRGTMNGGDQLQEQYAKGGFRRRAAMLTLTYRPGTDWGPRHVSQLLQHVRHWLARRSHRLSYVWVAELQKRGAVHFHVIVWLPKGLTLPKPDKQGWWPHGMSNVGWARKAVGYLAKYASKLDGTTHFPKHLRLHGRGGLEETRRRTVAWWLLPRFVREAFPAVGTRVQRAPGGGWCDVDTGHWIPGWHPPNVEPCGA